MPKFFTKVFYNISILYHILKNFSSFFGTPAPYNMEFNSYHFIGGDTMHIKIRPPKSKQILESELLKILSRKPIKRR